MALAKDLLRRDCALAEVAERVGYGSASTFSTAFSRHVRQSPGRYARSMRSLPAGMGKRDKLSDAEFAVFEQMRDKTPARSLNLG